MTHTPHPIAVLTGDIVNSTALGPAKLERAFAALEDCAAQQAAWVGDSLHFTRHRGDGWQVVLQNPAYSLRAALAFRAALRAEGEDFDSYIGIAEGPVSAPVGPDLNDETAPVFAASGGAMDNAKTSALDIRFFHARDGAKGAAIALADHISRGWTPAQAAAIRPQLDPTTDVTYTEIARILGKSRQAVTKSSEAGGMDAFDYAMACFEEAPHD